MATLLNTRKDIQYYMSAYKQNGVTDNYTSAVSCYALYKVNNGECNYNDLMCPEFVVYYYYYKTINTLNKSFKGKSASDLTDSYLKELNSILLDNLVSVIASKTAKVCSRGFRGALTYNSNTTINNSGITNSISLRLISNKFLKKSYIDDTLVITMHRNNLQSIKFAVLTCAFYLLKLLTGSTSNNFTKYIVA